MLKLKGKLDKGMYEALQEIAEGKGRYSTNQLLHASNTIEDMKKVAKKAIAKVDAGCLK